MTIQQGANLQGAKKISAAELTRTALDSIRRLEPKLNAYITILDERAMETAERLDAERARGVVRGPLHGIPVALKDVYCTKGIRTTVGSALFKDHVPDIDSAVGEKLEAAGAVIVGKTGMHELAYGVTSNNPHFGTIRNPWNLDCIPGGSSGGSGATVGARSVFMAMGSDTGGSIRIPAAYCGCVGIKPTTGRASRYGVMPLDFTLDHMGPLAGSVRDAAICMQAISGFDPRDDSSARVPVPEMVPATNVSLAGVRVGLPENFYFERVDPEVSRAVEALVPVLQGAGAEVVPVRVPDIAAINATGRVILMSEASACMSRYLGDRSKFGADIMALFDQGRLIAATDYVNAQRLRRVFQREWADLLTKVDCVLTPCAPIGAPKIGELEVEIAGQKEDTRLATTRFVRAINVLSLPALALPCGLTSARMPISAQLIGRPFDEPLLFRVGAAIEDTTDFHRAKPDL